MCCDSAAHGLCWHSPAGLWLLREDALREDNEIMSEKDPLLTTLNSLHAAVLRTKVPLPDERKPEKTLDIRLECRPTKGWEGQRWDVIDVIHEKAGYAIPDTGIYEIEVLKSLEEQVNEKLIRTLREECGELSDPETSYSIFIEAYDGDQMLAEAFEFIGRSA
jgi:hypothetical protein